MGTPAFALPSLRSLAAAHEVVAVYTRPDAVSGRGKALRPTPVKLLATEMGLPVRQPRTLRDADVQADLAAYAPDAIVVAAYGLILPPEVLAIPPYGCINVHGSLLPRWRGAAPVQRAILAGDDRTGVAIMRMEEGLDTGPYCATRTVVIGDKNADELADEIAEAGAAALLEALDGLLRDQCVWVEQDEDSATYADKITKSDVALSPELSVEQALRRIRASSDAAPARLLIDGRTIRILDARPARESLAESAVSATTDSLSIGLNDGSIEIVRLKPEGKGEMLARDWVRGARINHATWRAPV